MGGGWRGGEGAGHTGRAAVCVQGAGRAGIGGLLSHSQHGLKEAGEREERPDGDERDGGRERVGCCARGSGGRPPDGSLVAIGQEEHQMRVTADGEDPINGESPATQWVRRIDDGDRTRDVINDRGSLLYLIRG